MDPKAICQIFQQIIYYVEFPTASNLQPLLYTLFRSPWQERCYSTYNSIFYCTRP